MADRSFRVVDSRIQTWNLYPYEDTRLVVRDSVLGEILKLDNELQKKARIRFSLNLRELTWYSSLQAWAVALEPEPHQ